jgi:nicotinate-nucleotide adenylyltransferase
MNRKIGIFGGSFDPVHHGHLIAARDVMERHALDEIIFVPAKVSPHKLGKEPTAFMFRASMLILSMRSLGYKWSVDMREGRREGPSYAIETVLELKKENPSASFYYIIGDDNAAALPTWERYEELKEEVTFVVAERFAQTEEHGRKLHISSTEIRGRVKDGLPIDFLTPQIVIDYITENKIYKS